MLPLRNALSHNATYSGLRGVLTQFLRNGPRNYGPSKATRPHELFAADADPEEMAEMDYDSLEANFMDVSRSHKDHMDEMVARKKQQQYFLVKQKYFKEKYPNFLTWHDKEQIRHLHRTDPEQWSIQHLSESFPALPKVIAQLCKTNWALKTQHRVDKHDSSVVKNWEMFKTGQIADLPEELVEHLKKFTSRELNLKPFQLPKIDWERSRNKATTTVTEFSEIISSFRDLKGKREESVEPKNERTARRRPATPPDGDTYLAAEDMKYTQIATLSELKQHLQKRFDKGKELDEDDRLLLAQMKEKSEEKVPVMEAAHDGIVELSKNKHKTAGSVSNLVRKPERDTAHLVIAPYIKIPKELRKRGSIYKLNDCYYDDDGKFLYRVPGMF